MRNRQKPVVPPPTFNLAHVIVGILGGITFLAYIAKRLYWGPPPPTEGVWAFAPITLLIGCVCVVIVPFVWLLERSQGDKNGEAHQFVGCLGTLLSFVVLAPAYFTGFPGLSAGWQNSRWKRLLDVLANAVWVVAIAFVSLIWFVPDSHPLPPDQWWKLWLIVAIPSGIASAVRWAVIFVVDEPNKSETLYKDSLKESAPEEIDQPRVKRTNSFLRRIP